MTDTKLTHVGFYCLSCEDLVEQACHEGNVPVSVPMKWEGEMLDEIGRKQTGQHEVTPVDGPSWALGDDLDQKLQPHTAFFVEKLDNGEWMSVFSVSGSLQEAQGKRDVAQRGRLAGEKLRIVRATTTYSVVESDE